MKWADPGSSALILDIPEAEPLVGDFRRRHTPSGADGMTAHITLAAPFIPGPLLVGRLRDVRSVLKQFAAFQFRLTRLDRFDEGTVYLVPEPRDPFVKIATAVATSFPEHASTAAGHTEIVPHLTVARSDDPEVQTSIEHRLLDRLPLEAEARRVLLVVRGPDRRFRTRLVIELP